MNSPLTILLGLHKSTSKTGQLIPRHDTPTITYGKLTVYFGGMFSGKTDAVEAHIDRARHARINWQAFKPANDTRHGTESARSRRGNGQVGFDVTPIDPKFPHDILQKIDNDTRLIVLDEVQFFHTSLLSVVDQIRRAGITVIAAGLDLDYLGRPFGSTLTLAATATDARKLTAICMVCRHHEAPFSQMINVDGTPVTHDIYNDGSSVAIEGPTTYEARCGHCFVWPTPPPPTY